jgi:hypothetical protein
VAHDGSALDEADSTTVVNKLLLLFIQWCVSTVTVSSRISTTVGRISKIYSPTGTTLRRLVWYPDDGNFLTHNPPADTTNRGYCSRCKRTNKSSEIEMHGRVHGDLFNEFRVLLHGVQLQINFTKLKSDFYVMSPKGDTGTFFKFLDATLHVIRA